MIRDKKLQYHSNREIFRPYYQVKCLKREETLPSDQNRMIEEAKVPYFLLKKSFQKTNKNN